MVGFIVSLRFVPSLPVSVSASLSPGMYSANMRSSFSRLGRSRYSRSTRCGACCSSRCARPSPSSRASFVLLFLVDLFATTICLSPENGAVFALFLHRLVVSLPLEQRVGQRARPLLFVALEYWGTKNTRHCTRHLPTWTLRDDLHETAIADGVTAARLWGLAGRSRQLLSARCNLH